MIVNREQNRVDMVNMSVNMNNGMIDDSKSGEITINTSRIFISKSGNGMIRINRGIFNLIDSRVYINGSNSNDTLINIDSSNITLSNYTIDSNSSITPHSLIVNSTLNVNDSSFLNQHSPLIINQS